jgi:hypothetical protein
LVISISFPQTAHPEEGLATAGGMPFETQGAIARCLHPDSRKHVTEVEKDDAFKLFTAWKATKDKARRT